MDATTGKAWGFEESRLCTHARALESAKGSQITAPLPGPPRRSFGTPVYPPSMVPAINTNADSGSHFVPQHFDSSSARTRVPHHPQNSPYYPCYPSPPS